MFGDAFNDLPTSKIAAGSKFMDDFELIKKSFSGQNLDKKHLLNLPVLGKALKARKENPPEYDFDEFNVLIRG